MDPIAPAESPLEYIRRLDRFAAQNGMEVLEAGPGYARASMVVAERHLNSLGIVHGGALFSLADLAFGACANASGRTAVGVQMTLACVKAVHSGPLHAEAVEVSRSHKISTCTVRITTAEGELAAIFQGTAYIKNDPFPPAP